MKKLIKKSSQIYIVGNGTAAICAAEEISARNSDAKITIFSSEKERFYYRASVLNHMTGRITAKQLLGRPDQFYRDTKIRRIPRAIVYIDTAKQQLRDERGKKYYYDQLLLATGASPNRLRDAPDTSSTDKKRFVVRTIKDCQQLKKALSNTQKVTIIGGGFLGLEIAETLQKNFPVDTYIISREQYLLEKFISKPVSDIYYNELKKLGVTFIFNCSTKKISDNENGLSILLENGETIESDILIEAIGVHPEKELAESSGIKTGKGIIVNEKMQTSAENIYAAGDCAEVMSEEIKANYISGFHPVASIQGRIAGANISGAEAFFFPRMATISARIASINFTQIGHMKTSKPSHYFLESKIEGNNYKKILMDNKQIVSAFISGDFNELNLILELINNKKILQEHFIEELQKNNLGFFKSIDYL